MPDISTLVFDVTTVALLVIAVAWVPTGLYCWRKLAASAASYDDLEIVLAARVTWAGRIGKAALVLTWPLWYALPKLFMLPSTMIGAIRKPVTFP